MSVAPDARSYRLDDIDILRGLAIVVMALDHVRDYFMLAAEQDPMADPHVAASLFFTRWITHYCAPVFVFLAGTSAGLMASRRTPAQLGGFLLRRGLWLIAIEVVVVAQAWTFAPRGIAELGGKILISMQVIWVIGLAMVVLAGLQKLGRAMCFSIGLAILLSHNLLDLFWPKGGVLETGLPWWVPLHAQAAYSAGPFILVFVYPAIPWIGVMLLGFGSAAVFEQPEAQRRRSLLLAGVIIVTSFILLRLLDAYGDPNTWQRQSQGMATLFDFLNVSKYPPSLLYALMTLGPAALLCMYASRLPAGVRRPLVVFGRVPFVFYIAHLYLIHALSILLAWLQGFDPRLLLNDMYFYPKGYGLSLPGIYLVWVLVVVMLYPLCRWMADVKSRRRDWWLSYL